MSYITQHSTYNNTHIPEVVPQMAACVRGRGKIAIIRHLSLARSGTSTGWWGFINRSSAELWVPGCRDLSLVNHLLAELLIADVAPLVLLTTGVPCGPDGA